MTNIIKPTAKPKPKSIPAVCPKCYGNAGMHLDLKCLRPEDQASAAIALAIQTR